MEYLLQDKVVSSLFEDTTLQLLFSKGLFVIITVNLQTCDIINIQINKILLSKFHTDAICVGVIVDKQIVYVCTDGRVHSWGGVWKDDWVIDGGFRRKLAVHKDLVCIWGCISVDKLHPWTPLAKDHQRSNIVLYWVGPGGPELLAHKKTEGDPILVAISKVDNRSLITIEQKVSFKGAVTVDVNVLELTGSNLKRTSTISVPLQTQISCTTISDNENYVLLGCIDGSLALLNRRCGTTQVTKTSLIPTQAAWHKSSIIFTISNEKGQLQYYDIALNRINTEIAGDDLTPLLLLDLACYFTLQPRVSIVKWGLCNIVVVMEGGPLIVISHTAHTLSFTSTIQYYLKSDKVDQAIRLLLAWEWNDQCLSALQKIVVYLMKCPLTEDNAAHLQKALSCFHSPPVDLSIDIRHKYGSQVLALTRRFFHQLVRYKMFETAFLLAIDIGHHDLFMDLYYCASKLGEREMAAAARAQASSLLSRCSSEASCCSRSSCSQCSSSESDDRSVSPSDKTEPQGDDYLTTNFNDIDPTTYSTSDTNYYIDLPKLTITSKPPPLVRANKVPLIPPPLPVAPPPLPLAPVLLNNRTTYLPPQSSVDTSITPNRNFFSQQQPRFDYQKCQPMYDVRPTPLQTIPESVPTKKPPAKVKFSDTVTAFIVPEIKRPVRPPPPPHITDPQRELADSLPLCHPNEDYLKDFTPIQHDSEDTNVPPNIKVIHFGVV